MIFNAYMWFANAAMLSGALGALIGFGIWCIEKRWSRIAVLLAVLAIPTLLMASASIEDGCLIKPIGEKCYYLGFGIVLTLFYITPIWVACLAFGAGIRILTRNR